MADPTYADLVTRVAALEQGLALKQLPLEQLKTYLESDWQPDSGLLLPPKSIGTDLIEDGSITGSVLPTVPHARVFNNAAISINNATITALTFNSERWDTVPTGLTEQHSTSANTGRLTCQVAGLYSIGGNIEFPGNATGARYLDLRVTFAAGGTAMIAQQAIPAPVATELPRLNVSTEYRLAVGDFVELRAYQSSGGALNVNSTANTSPEFWFSWRSA